MKRFALLLFCFLLALPLASCDFGAKPQPQQTTVPTTTPAISKSEVEAYVKDGELFGVPLKLHTRRADIEKQYPTIPTGQAGTGATNAASPKEDIFLQINEGRRLTQFIAGSCHYYYVTGAEVNGVSIIVSMNNAFKLPAGATESDITAALGKPDFSDVPAGEELFFLFETPDNAKRMTYLFGDRRLDFILVGDNLSATVLTDTNLYNDFTTPQTTK